MPRCGFETLAALAPQPPGRVETLAAPTPQPPGTTRGSAPPGAEGHDPVAREVVQGGLAARGCHQQVDEPSLDEGAVTVAPVRVGGPEGQTVDAVLGADQRVRALVEVEDGLHGVDRVVVLDAQGAPDVLGVHDRL